MNIVNRNHKQKGIGLIEILIVLVVLVIGWAAIAALQGTLMSGSSASKARNEALELAREKTEEMRNAVEKGKFVSDLGATSGSDDAITGVNAVFTRSWVLDSVDVNGDSVKEDYLKQLSMKVSWTNNEGVTEDVVLNSMIVFASATNMGSLATGGSGDAGETATPGAYSATEGPTRPGIAIGPGTKDEDGDASNGSEDVYTSTDADGNLVVYTGSNVAANVNLTVYGGKILKFSGMIYYDSPAPYVRATSPSYCTTFTRTKAECGITDNSSSTQCAKYVCYAGGDCSNGGDGCPTDSGALAALPTNLNGGWYGKIGDFFPTLSNALQFPTICMGDSIDVPARFYVTKRVATGTTTGYEREGINTSFECTDNLISAANDTACEDLIAELKSYGIAVDPNADPNEIADFEMVRPLASGATNVVLAATNDSYYNGVFDNFCGGGTPSSSSSSGGTTSSGSSSGSTSSSGSSSGGPGYTHMCSCNYRNAIQGVESVTGMTADGTPEIGCCKLEDCNATIPTDISNNSTFVLTCSMP